MTRLFHLCSPPPTLSEFLQKSRALVYTPVLMHARALVYARVDTCVSQSHEAAFVEANRIPRKKKIQTKRIESRHDPGVMISYRVETEDQKGSRPCVPAAKVDKFGARIDKMAQDHEVMMGKIAEIYKVVLRGNSMSGGT